MPQEPDAAQTVTRAEAVGRLYEELATITRRASARERAGDSPLTLVDHGLLELVRAQAGISPAELARVLGLNRSTTSRQIAALARAGLLERGEGRGGSYVLTLTAAGVRALESSRAAHLAALESRLGSWDADRIRALVAVLADFNGSD
jgi:DNA-binding MarR family transcriptional regulator